VLNASGAYLLDKSTKDYRIAADFGRIIINEITFYVNNSIEKVKSLAEISPLFVNALLLIFAETFKEDQLPSPIIGSMITEFIQSSTAPSFMCMFAVPGHADVAAHLLGSFFRWTVLGELYEEKSSYSKLHLKVVECLNNVDQVQTDRVHKISGNHH
jgi:Domain of unknown function (DUF4507)